MKFKKILILFVLIILFTSNVFARENKDDGIKKKGYMTFAISGGVSSLFKDDKFVSIDFIFFDISGYFGTILKFDWFGLFLGAGISTKWLILPISIQFYSKIDSHFYITDFIYPIVGIKLGIAGIGFQDDKTKIPLYLSPEFGIGFEIAKIFDIILLGCIDVIYIDDNYSSFSSQLNLQFKF